MDKRGLGPEEQRLLIQAALAEAVVLFGGVAGYLATGRMAWIIGAVMLGIGITGPVMIRLLKARK
ncbi:MAG: hypothetical protein AAFQ22_06500 [Pseudomonadota bacterium]